VIEIDVILDNNGVLRSCKACGHAGAGKAGTDIVCAAVSVLLRTALSTLSGREGVIIQGGAPQKGQLWLEAEYKANGKDFLFAIGEYLVNGLSSVAKEFPDNCKLTIKNQGF